LINQKNTVEIQTKTKKAHQGHGSPMKDIFKNVFVSIRDYYNNVLVIQ